MVTAVIAQPAEPIVSVAELPRGAPAQAPSCWPITATLIELSAATLTGLARAIVAASAVAMTAVGRQVRGRNCTEREPRVHGGTNGAHLDARPGRKQTDAMTQGGRLDRP